MARPLRIEFPGAVYHVTSRGDRQEKIYRDDDDRRSFLRTVGQMSERFDARLLAYCLMGNHYHLVLQTRQANLSRCMRQLNGVYTQAFNRRHALTGHLFQGRFKAILVDRDSYLATLCRYVERNPVAARLVRSCDEWEWSSFRAHIGAAVAPPWLDLDTLYGHLLGRDPQSDRDRAIAARRYAGLVQQKAAEDAGLWRQGLRQQIFLGDEDFAMRMLATAPVAAAGLREVPRAQRVRRRTLTQWIAQAATRAEGLRQAYREGGMTMTAIAGELGLSVSRVSRLIAVAEAAEAKGKT